VNLVAGDACPIPVTEQRVVACPQGGLRSGASELVQGPPPAISQRA
jgi:hypothetical protein